MTLPDSAATPGRKTDDRNRGVTCGRTHRLHGQLDSSASDIGTTTSTGSEHSTVTGEGGGTGFFFTRRGINVFGF